MVLLVLLTLNDMTEFLLRHICITKTTSECFEFFQGFFRDLKIFIRNFKKSLGFSPTTHGRPDYKLHSFCY